MWQICKREDLAARVTVEKIVYDFPENYADNDEKTITGALAGMQKIHEVTDTTQYRPTPDERLYVDGMEIHILNTPIDCSYLEKNNDMSLVFTVQRKGKKILFTGDYAMHFGPCYDDSAGGNRWAEQNADVIYKAFEGTVEIPL